MNFKAFYRPSGLALVCVLLLVVSMPTRAYDDYEQEVNSLDPWESMNRGIFAFNDRFDQWFIRPLAKGYRWIMPEFAENGVSRFFSNLDQLGSSINAVFQQKWSAAGEGFANFAVNTTFGIAGFFDVATEIGLEPTDEDFGQTLGHYGISSGPYLVLPFLGPSTVRDTAGLFPDRFLDPTHYLEHVRTKNTVMGLEILDLRASLLDVEKLISGDKYAFLRDAYLQRREYLVNDGEVEDEFLDDDW